MGKKRVGSKGGVGGDAGVVGDAGKPCQCPVSRCKTLLTPASSFHCTKCDTVVCNDHKFPDDHKCDELIAKKCAKQEVKPVATPEPAAKQEAPKPAAVVVGNMFAPATPKVEEAPKAAGESGEKKKKKKEKASEDDLPPPQELSAEELAALDDEGKRAHVATLFEGLGAADKPKRREAAYGIAGVVAHLGVRTLRDLGVMEGLVRAATDKKSVDSRVGAAVAVAFLVDRVGRRFEPYTLPLLLPLLNLFGEAQSSARDAGDRALRKALGMLTPYAMRMAMPALFAALENKSYRVKEAALQLMGIFVKRAPEQLGTMLPQVLPKLVVAINDTHPKVGEAALEAFREATTVIRNPELQTLAPGLIDATVNPDSKTEVCLNQLMEQTFVNAVDSAGLALVVPVLTRGLKERKSDLKKKAAKTTGNMCALVSEARFLAPFVPMLLPEVKKALVDQSPEVRSFAAWALASLLKGMGADDVDAMHQKIEELQEQLVGEDASLRKGGEAGLESLVDSVTNKTIKRCVSAPSLVDQAEAAA